MQQKLLEQSINTALAWLNTSPRDLRHSGERWELWESGRHTVTTDTLQAMIELALAWIDKQNPN